jgi:hypothetical protein
MTFTRSELIDKLEEANDVIQSLIKVISFPLIINRHGQEEFTKACDFRDNLNELIELERKKRHSSKNPICTCKVITTTNKS